MSESSALRVTDRLMEVLLFKIRPGRLGKALEALSQCERDRLYVSYGYYDVILVREVTEPFQQPRLLGIDGALDALSILCFSWGDLPDAVWSSAAPDSGRAVLVFCLRMDERALARHGIEAEHRVARKLSGALAKKGLSCSLLGGLGSAQIVGAVAHPRDNLESLLKAWHVVAPTLTLDVDGEELQAVADTVLLPCVRRDVVEKALVDSEESARPSDKETCTAAAGRLKNLLPGRFRASISVSCVPGSEGVIVRELGKWFGTKGFHTVSGRTYIIGRVVKPHAEFLPSMFRFRLRCSEYIRRTATLVEGGGPESGQGQPRKPPPIADGLLKLPSRAADLVPRIDRMRAENPLLAAEVSRFLEVMVASLNDSSMWRFVADLGPFAQELMSLTETAKDRDDYGRLGTASEIGLTALFERHASAYPFIHNPTAMLLGRHPVSKRGIDAVSEYMRWLLARIGRPKWRGAVVVGYRRMPWAGPLGLVNMPPDSIFSPIMWWPLAHEAGHELVELLDSEGRNQELDEAARRAEVPFPFRRSLEEIQAVAGEVLADLISYRVQFGSDWDMYLTTVWSYLSRTPLRYRREHENVLVWLLRAALVDLSRRRDDEEITEEIAASCAEETWERCRKVWGGCYGERPSAQNERRLEILEYWRERLPAWVQGFEPLVRTAVAISDRAISQGIGTDEEAHPVDSTLATLQRGGLITDLGDPSALVSGLLSRADPDTIGRSGPGIQVPAGRSELRTHLALILSIWHQYCVRRLPEQLYGTPTS